MMMKFMVELKEEDST